MKKLLAFLLALTMAFPLAACGGSELEEAAKEIEEITGIATTADDVKASMEELEVLTGEKVTPQDVVDFTREMYELLDGDWSDDEPDDEAWPFDDIPEWPVAEGLDWNNYYGDDRIDLYVSGGEAEMNMWLEGLRGVGFKGFFRDGDELDFYREDYWIYLDDRGADEGEYHLVICSGDIELGIPEEIAHLFPAYNGDGALVYGGMDEYDSEQYHYFSAIGETTEGGQRYLQALKDAGFVSKYDSYYSGAGGYYYKTQGGLVIGYASEEYWYEFDDANDTGWADFCLTVSDE